MWIGLISLRLEAGGIVVTETFSFVKDGKFTDQLSVCHVWTEYDSSDSWMKSVKWQRNDWHTCYRIYRTFNYLPNINRTFSTGNGIWWVRLFFFLLLLTRSRRLCRLPDFAFCTGKFDMHYWSDICENFDSHTGVSKDWSNVAHDAVSIVPVVFKFWRIIWPSEGP